MLAFADFSRPFILEMDASHSGLGLVLSQETEGGVRPIAFTSLGLLSLEQNIVNYSSMKLEFLVLKWTMTEKLCEDLLGHRCVVFTDNNPLSYLQSAKLEHKARLEMAFGNARERLLVAAERRIEHHDQGISDAPPQVGQLVYLRDPSARGRHEIQYLWSSVVYQVMRAPSGGGPVYTIAPVDDLQKTRNVL